MDVINDWTSYAASDQRDKSTPNTHTHAHTHMGRAVALSTDPKGAKEPTALWEEEETGGQGSLDSVQP